MAYMHTDWINRTLVLMALLILPAFGARGQSYSKKVHKLPEVQVIAKRKDYYSEDQKIMRLDSATLAQYKSNSLGELISIATPVHIKSYGAKGALAVPNFRGTSAQHTAVTWNGFPINTMTLGQCDLSLFPSEFADQVSLTHSAPASLYGSGTFGGAISMDNRVDWNKKQALSLSGQLGSWNNQRYGLEGAVGNKKVHYRLRGLYQEATNDFKYKDYHQFGQPIEKRRHNAVRNIGVMQNIFYKPTARSKFEAGLWYQYRNKELPDIMGVSGESHASQKDSVLRAYAGWKGVFDHSALQVRSAFFYHHQLYKEKENAGDDRYMIHSPITTKKWMNDLNYRYYLNNRMTLDLGLQYSHMQADVDAYPKPVGEYRAALIGAFKYKNKNLTANASVRQQLNSYNNPLPQFSLGANYRPVKNLFVRTHFSTKYRLPTLNDKYWQPGGNKDLKPEHGWSGEIALGYVMDHNRLQAQTKMELTAYQSNIHELIEWVPMEGASLWHPINTSHAQTTGLEASLNHTFRWNQLELNIRSLYNYTRAKNLNKNQPEVYGKQLRYTPYHTFKNQLNTAWRQYNLGTSVRYTGKRYSTMDNDPAGMLEDYFLIDLSVSRKMQMKNIHGSLRLSVKNLLDRQYQIIANYPMPGRAYYINLSVQLNQLF